MEVKREMIHRKLSNYNVLFASNIDPRNVSDYYNWMQESVAFMFVNDKWIPLRKDCMNYRVEDFEFNDSVEELAK